VIRSWLVIEPAADGAAGWPRFCGQTRPAAYGQMELRGPVSIVSGAFHIELANVLTGVIESSPERAPNRS
jgi:hypothetical protein